MSKRDDDDLDLTNPEALADAIVYYAELHGPLHPVQLTRHLLNDWSPGLAHVELAQRVHAAAVKLHEEGRLCLTWVSMPGKAPSLHVSVRHPFE